MDMLYNRLGYFLWLHMYSNISEIFYGTVLSDLLIMTNRIN